jgi:hypothetical protein
MECCLECDLEGVQAAVLDAEAEPPQLTVPPSNQAAAAATANEKEEEEVSTASSTTSLVDEDCMLCLERFHISDKLVPVLCPLPACTFNYCTSCVWNLLLSSSQPYQEASDGSKQLKVQLQCPQCRTKYPHRQIVQDILLLRQAVRLQPLFFEKYKESNLKASELATKQAFLEQVSWEALNESWLRVNKYFQDRHKNDTDSSAEYFQIPKLPPQWKEHLIHQPPSHPQQQQDDPQSKLYMTGMGQAQYTLVDPTLFRGMEEAMTLCEQQFLSELLVSGSVPSLVQAAMILHGMLQMMHQGGLKARAAAAGPSKSSSSSSTAAIHSSFSNLSQDSNKNNKKNNNFRLLTTGSTLLYPDMDLNLLKKRFPLPATMPRWILMPVYHPNKRGAPLKVKQHTWGLEIKSVSGSAGQQGIRKGDVVTHVNEETCESLTVEEFSAYMLSLYNTANATSDSNANQTMSLVVNAHPEAAQALQQRSFEMIHFLTQKEREKQQQSTNNAAVTNHPTIATANGRRFEQNGSSHNEDSYETRNQLQQKDSTSTTTSSCSRPLSS